MGAADHNHTGPVYRLQELRRKLRTGQIVVAHIGLVYDRIHSVIVPTIGIVVRDDDNQVPPFRTSLKPVDGLNEKCLLIDRIGISRVTIESALRFQVAYGR